VQVEGLVASERLGGPGPWLSATAQLREAGGVKAIDPHSLADKRSKESRVSFLTAGHTYVTRTLAASDCKVADCQILRSGDGILGRLK
jgi:hypothetical protein